MIPLSLLMMQKKSTAVIPGNQELLSGSATLGWYGETPASSFLNTAGLLSLLGLNLGVSTVGTDNEPWLKFSHLGKILFVAKRPLRHSISWNTLAANSLIAGRNIIHEGITYKVRLLTGVVPLGAPSPTSNGSEWNELIYRVSSTVGITPKFASYSDAQIGVAWLDGMGAWSLCQGSYNGNAAARGGGSITGGNNTYALGRTVDNSNTGWRPVLEVVGG